MTTPQTAPEVPTPAGAVLDPFTVLGLSPTPDLTDEQVHDAWQRRLAADRDGAIGTDDEGTITGAYEALRSGVRRAEALSDLTEAWDRAPAGGEPESSTGERAMARMPKPRQPEERIDSIVPSPEEREELRRIVAQQRKEQGLPAFIEDEATLDKIIDILLHSHDRPEDRYQRSHAGHEPGDELGGLPPWDAERSHAPGPSGERQRQGVVAWLGSWVADSAARVRHGRPLWLAGRILIAVAVPVSAYIAEPGYPAWIALAVGAATFLAFTARFDLAGRVRR